MISPCVVFGWSGNLKMLGRSLSHGCLSLHYNGELETVPDSAQLTDSGSINKWFKYIHLQNLNRYYNTQRGKSVKTSLDHIKPLLLLLLRC